MKPAYQVDEILSKPKRRNWRKERQSIYKTFPPLPSAPPLPQAHDLKIMADIAASLAIRRMIMADIAASLAIRRIEEILYPNGNRDASWNADTLDTIARVIDGVEQQYREIDKER